MISSILCSKNLLAEQVRLENKRLNRTDSRSAPPDGGDLRAKWLTLEHMGQLLYTTDQFIEQMKTFLNNELELIALVDQIQTLRAKYQKDSKLSNYYAKVGMNVLAALFSSSESNPKVFRELDQLAIRKVTSTTEKAFTASALENIVIAGYLRPRQLCD